MASTLQLNKRGHLVDGEGLQHSMPCHYCLVLLQFYQQLSVLELLYSAFLLQCLLPHTLFLQPTDELHTRLEHGALVLTNIPHQVMMCFTLGWKQPPKLLDPIIDVKPPSTFNYVVIVFLLTVSLQSTHLFFRHRFFFDPLLSCAYPPNRSLALELVEEVEQSAGTHPSLAAHRPRSFTARQPINV